MNEKELLEWLQANPNSTIKDVANAFPRASGVSISSVLHGAQKAGKIASQREKTDEGKFLVRYSIPS